MARRKLKQKLTWQYGTIQTPTRAPVSGGPANLGCRRVRASLMFLGEPMKRDFHPLGEWHALGRRKVLGEGVTHRVVVRRGGRHEGGVGRAVD